MVSLLKSNVMALLKHIDGSDAFRKNIVRVASGSGLSKLIGLISLPFLSRLFVPEDFAAYAYFIAVYTIVTSVTTLRFEWLVPNAKNEREAAELTMTGFYTVLVIVTVIALGIFLAKSSIEQVVFKGRGIAEAWPLVFLITVLFGSFQYLLHGWLVYIGNLSYFALSLVIQTTTTAVLSILFALTIPDSVMSGSSKLIIAYNCGLLMACVTIYLAHLESFAALHEVELKAVKSCFLRNRKLAMDSVLVSLVNAFASNLTLFLIGALFGQRVMGIYALTNRLVFAPVIFVTSSIANSFWAEAARLAKEDMSLLRKFYIGSLKRLTVLAALVTAPMIGLSFFLEPLLGSDWEGAGLMCLALTPLVLATLIFSSTNHLVVYGKQIYQLFCDGAGVLVASATLIICQFSHLSPFIAIFLAMTVLAIGYVVRGWMHLYALSNHMDKSPSA